MPNSQRYARPEAHPRRASAVAVALATAVLCGCAGDPGNPSASETGASVSGPSSPATAPTTGAASTGGSASETQGPVLPSGDFGASDGAASAPPPASVGAVISWARRNMIKARSVRVTGKLMVNGTLTAMAAAGTLSGTNHRLVLSSPKTGTVEVLTVAGAWYLKGDKAFLAATKNKNANLLVGKYVRLTPAQGKSFRPSTVGGIVRELFASKDLLSLETAPTAAAATTYQGRPAYSVGQSVTADRSEIVISSPPGPMRLLAIRSGTSDQGMVTFSQWDAVPAVAAPPANAIVALS